MPRTLNRLTALAVSTARKRGMRADGGGLYCQIGHGGARSWVFRFKYAGKEHWMGLGSVAQVTLGAAREAATDCRRQIAEGIDPLAHRGAARAKAAAEAAAAISFRECAERYVAAHSTGWRNAKHAAQWGSTLGTYAFPLIGDLPVTAVQTDHVLKVLEPLWTTKAETASRLRGRIEAVINWAAARKLRVGENPARWRGHLDQLLPARSKVRKVQHHAALPYAEVAAFMTELRAQDGNAARALEFVILTAGRTAEVIGARWVEVDFSEAIWTIPGERMKSGRGHRVPLSSAALAVLKTMMGQSAEFVFPGRRATKSLSDAGMLAVLRRMHRRDITPHGFRSSFRDWAAERTSFANEIAEMALAHQIGDKTEEAYRRGDLLEKRRRLMGDWAAFCGSAKSRGAVVPIRGERA